jgi:hypothetical protein
MVSEMVYILLSAVGRLADFFLQEIGSVGRWKNLILTVSVDEKGFSCPPQENIQVLRILHFSRAYH